MKCLIIGPSWVGDMVMAQSLFISLKQQTPELIIDVLAPDWTRSLLERMPEVNSAIPMSVGHGKLGLGMRLALAKDIQTEAYDQAIVLPNSFKSALVPLFAKIPIRTGWRGEARSWILNDCRQLDKQKLPLMVQRFAALAYPKNTSLPPELPNPTLQVNLDLLSSLKEKFTLNSDRPVLVLCPGAEFGVSKKWPEKYYGEIARLAIQNGQQVWLMGSENDQETARKIQHDLSNADLEHCINFAGKTLLGEAIDLISLASAVLSNDSGLMHIAAALNKPLVVIYGSTSDEFTPPLASKVRVVSQELDCRPCFERECPLLHLKCLMDLKPEKVWQALKEVQFSNGLLEK